ncbi:molybdopterin molybdotransferase MoeA [Limnospira fusiformis KN01]|uniref:Molybdopterin molybdenumtransferase n=1 Tax=Limnospira fusiformis PMC 851.14 TaxID=2219512 RepID=A0ABU9EQF5_LIMFS|nr:MULTISPECIES: gephyrin-like molybdotransferase Glp [Limnospira]MDY7055137.1 molybdopterin molybdotransferase MoeA [Limnospira fusiformis LS22]MDT9189856.1 molybdopterin molybdotransferase MoeA [Limnospira sp. PMC 894.15]MDT9198225.1 molybdopterin molybdotransferase MoeA [Limnospira sp. PMC 1042.18]MDT9274635.1 molybdopterin molybdotransferase MoeA [Limnospira sp. PMC 737.11]QNH58852.1 MAG: molybdopterin molybdotransferase MoeA [Limnospira indica BM01]
MLSAQAAEAIILEQVGPPHQQDIELVKLSEATGRILAAPITSELDFPHWDNSAMDGYAVRYADVAQSSAENPVTLAVIEEIPAGYCPQKTIAPGQAARIFTGACLPAGADTIVIQEDTQPDGDRIKILTTPELRAFVRHQGSYSRAGDPLLPAGISLGVAEIAVLAAAKCVQVPVYAKLKVGLISTGNELIPPEHPIAPGKLVDSNQYALASWVMQMGAEPVILGIIPDEPEALKTAIAKALLSADIVLSTGGVSVGDYDYVGQILADLGGEILVNSVAVKPGKPLTFATFPHCLYFGLPGNPVSALVTCWRFVQPALRKRSGLTSEFWGPEWWRVRSPMELRSGGKRETYLWGNLRSVNGETQFILAPGSQNSGNLINLAQTNALAMLPVGQTCIEAGEFVQILKVR